MFDDHPADRFVVGVLIGSCVGVFVTLLVVYVESEWRWRHNDNLYGLLGCAFLVTLLLTMTRPALLCTILRSRRSPFLFDVDLYQTLLGRFLGAGLGVFLGATMSAQFG
ncbi:hypothetical protein ACS0ZG_32300 [Burkholderia gladioli]|uniref:hypothetical protein n=1 Tax=Burkholderia gladioli TaxID=28095 RepID=UPI0030D58E1B